MCAAPQVYRNHLARALASLAAAPLPTGGVQGGTGAGVGAGQRIGVGIGVSGGKLPDTPMSAAARAFFAECLQARTVRRLRTCGLVLRAVS